MGGRSWKKIPLWGRYGYFKELNNKKTQYHPCESICFVLLLNKGTRCAFICAQNHYLTISVLVFKSTIISFLTWKLFSYLTVCTTWQGVALGTAKMIPQQPCELSVCNRPKEPARKKMNCMSASDS